MMIFCYNNFLKIFKIVPKFYCYFKKRYKELIISNYGLMFFKTISSRSFPKWPLFFFFWSKMPSLSKVFLSLFSFFFTE